MFFRLHRIPDTVVEFTGFAIQGDLVAWDFPGLFDASQYRHGGAAKVRNVVLPVTYNHITVPITHRLAVDPKARAWINAYAPSNAVPPTLGLAEHAWTRSIDAPTQLLGFHTASTHSNR